MRGVAVSWAFARNASLSSILVAASWSSASVFTSFYLSDVQFSSSQGFSLGHLVEAGSVVWVFLTVVVLFIPSLTAGSECPSRWGGRCSLFSASAVPVLASQESECGF